MPTLSLDSADGQVAQIDVLGGAQRARAVVELALPPGAVADEDERGARPAAQRVAGEPERAQQVGGACRSPAAQPTSASSARSSPVKPPRGAGRASMATIIASSSPASARTRRRASSCAASRRVRPPPPPSVACIDAEVSTTMAIDRPVLRRRQPRIERARRGAQSAGRAATASETMRRSRFHSAVDCVSRQHAPPQIGERHLQPAAPQLEQIERDERARRRRRAPGPTTDSGAPAKVTTRSRLRGTCAAPALRTAPRRRRDSRAARARRRSSRACAQ